MTIYVSIDCPRCHTCSAVPVDALLVTVAATDDPDIAGHASWLCRTCVDLVAVPLAWAGMSTLIGEGALLLDEDGEGELLPPHPESPATGPTFAPDDLLELHELLGNDAWFQALAAGVGCANP